MYAQLKCRASLPGKPPAWITGSEHIFQTKDFEQNLDLYVITEEGRLFLHGDVALYTTGTINFYDGKSIDDDWYWVEYLASFENGKLVNIKEITNEVDVREVRKA